MEEPKDGVVFDFNIRQYFEHRQTLLAAAQEERQMEKHVLLACGVFYSWLATQTFDVGVLYGIAACVPVVIVLLSLLRANAITHGIRTEANYLIKLEKRIYMNAPEGYDEPNGWETFLADEGKYVDRYLSTDRVFWYVLLFFTVLASGAFSWFQK